MEGALKGQLIIITRQGRHDKNDRLFTMAGVSNEIRRQKRLYGNKNMLAAVRDSETGLYRLFERVIFRDQNSNSEGGTNSISS